MNESEEGFDAYSNHAFDMAMRYLQMGWSIIPIRISDKMPAVTWANHQTVKATEEEVTSWFNDGVPDGNGGFTKAFGLAVITGAISGLVVVDCDTQDALTYAVTEAGLFSMLTVATTRGQHMYFKHPGGGVKVQNKAGGLGRDWPEVPGLDLRGDGGYVVAPPSLKFDEEGRLKHSYRFNCPLEELESFVDTLPVWNGIKIKEAQAPVGEWSFDNLKLSAVKSYGATVWDDAAARVKRLGRKMQDGDGRNPWLVRYIGECISSGMDESQARDASARFQDEFYSPALSKEESETVLQSVVISDKRNHPERYAKPVEEVEAGDRPGRSNAIRLIRPDNLDALRQMSSGSKYLIDPFIPPQSIIQVVGFNGHGKSLWLLNMLWAAARGQNFGSAYVQEKIKALYMDFEGSSTIISERIDTCIQMHGDMSEDLSIWNANVADDDMRLTTPEGLAKVAGFINEVQPQVVVIDTVRQAWQGMEENSPQSWMQVNNMAMACRNAGMSVVLVHHRNKPNMQGHGREAGSTAQLKDLDAQIIVTKVVCDLDQAKREAAMPDSATSVEDISGATQTAWTYLRRAAKDGYDLRMVFELSFGKLRQATDNHVTTYVGITQDRATGRWHTVSSLIPVQKAIALHNNGVDLQGICNTIGVSQPTIQRWLSTHNNSEQK